LRSAIARGQVQEYRMQISWVQAYFRTLHASDIFILGFHGIGLDGIELDGIELDGIELDGIVWDSDGRKRPKRMTMIM
jgi:hypothetical protein